MRREREREQEENRGWGIRGTAIFWTGLQLPVGRLHYFLFFP